MTREEFKATFSNDIIDYKTSIYPWWRAKNYWGIDLEIDYDDGTISVDALIVYEKLKEYFKGTEYE